jgi:hypothetical protein
MVPLKQPSIDSPGQQVGGWTYAELTVIDGARRLAPTHMAFDRLQFDEPPRLTASTIEIILVNGADERRSFAEVLPHDGGATRIPIRLVPRTA